ncbi:cytochrome ubiquinol oxidase subunit I [Caminibacter mediatlanticus TB-2]|uniref:Cytochrome ubiquinol oxidase subunit I n=1 Tax=Caminibacter mediatlanticus TB-2 TaxID=391592 RepID=A0ABX5V625_9BACT|nr:cytochrome ubiquinol oxidase subunit I [Caminibacter mediatlanticus]QCT93725.1 cytochrome ubiquinol oxidase subunit I [Caminibacter mediatlanticus TB-2]
MNIDLTMLEWARAQFAMTALFHFFFVPFTLGMSFMVAFFETIYVKTGKKEWKEITQFWQLIFGINFAIGLSTGIIHEFEFGTNWSTYSWVVGDLFGAPLAVEGIVAFFMEATFAAISFFGWKRVSKGIHLASTWLLAIGSNLSALWILIANGFMQHPSNEFGRYSIENARLEMTDFWALITQPVAQVKFLHTISASYTLASIFVLGISAFYLLRKKHIDFAKKSAAVAAAFGLVASIFTAVIGDEHAYQVTNTQPTKIAAVEGLYIGKKGAPIVAIGIPKNLKATEVTSNDEAFVFKIELPKMLSILGKHRFNAYVPGLKDLIEGNPEYGIWPLKKLAQIGKEAREDLYKYHEAKKTGDTATMQAAKEDFYKVVWEDPKTGIKLTKADFIGYGYFANPNIDPDLIHPPVPPVFYAFHIMVALGFWFIILFIWAWVAVVKGSFETNALLQRLAVLSVPLPWIATSFGWMTAEIGRQPWTVFGVLPTAESVTPIALQNVQATFFMFLTAFVILGIAELKILFTVVKSGPKGAH